MATSATVRLQALDGTWEVVGKDRLTGIYPESVTCSANGWGSDTCSFVLRRDPKAIHPDLGAFTPCDIEIEGQPAWSGRVWETPTKEGDDAQISVAGKGWQYHLDDDVYRPCYVHADLSDWQDVRALPTTNLANYAALPSVGADSGALTITYPQGVAAYSGTAICFDSGPLSSFGAFRNSKIVRIVIDWSVSVGAANRSFYFQYSDDGVSWTNGTTIYNTVPGAGSGTTAYTLGSASRYVALRYDANAHTPAADEFVRITRALVFTATAFESGNASNLTASTVVTDAVPMAPLLSPQTSSISTTAFAIPEFFFGESKTPREVVDAVNVFHNYRTLVDIDRVLHFEPLPSTPLYETSGSRGVEFEDTSANSGEEIYNKVLIEGTGPDGQPLSVVRTTSTAYSATVPASDGTPQPDNMAQWNTSFDVDLSNWGPVGGTLTRTTTGGEFDSAPAGAKFVSTSGSDYVEATNMLGTWQRGRTYQLQFRMKTSGGAAVDFSWGDMSVAPLAGSTVRTNVATTTSFQTFAITWTPLITTNSATFRLIARNIHTIFFDSFSVVKLGHSLADRRGFARSLIFPIESNLTVAAANQIGDVYLTNHQTTPFRGGAVAKTGALRRLGGPVEGVHPVEALRAVGELIRFTDRIDPDTGSLGREGRIASVTYTQDTQTAQIEIDNERRNFEALLSRLAVLTPANK